MSYNYTVPQNYYPQNTGVYNGVEQKKSSSPLVGLGIVGCGTIGGVVASRNTHYLKNGDVKDSFAKTVHGQYIKQAASDSEKLASEQINNVVKGLKHVKTADELKTLLNNNPKVKGKISANFLKSVNDNNIENNIATVKETVIAQKKQGLRTIKNKIAECWNAENKTFVKTRRVNEDTFKIIEKCAKKFKAGVIAKAIVICGAAGALKGYIADRIIQKKKSQKV